MFLIFVKGAERIDAYANDSIIKTLATLSQMLQIYCSKIHEFVIKN